MCVCRSGWIELVMATPAVKSVRACCRGTVAPRIDSELVRVSAPTRSESPGNAPAAFIRCRRVWVPSAPAANTTWSASITSRRGRSHAPVRAVSTRKPAPAGRTAVTVVSGRTVAPARSASHR